MQQIIEVEVPEGKKAIWKDGKVVFKDISPKLPETWEEFCKLYPVKAEEVFIGSDSKFLCCEGTRFCYVNRNVLPSLEAAEAHLALMQLHQLRDCYRQGWVPDWKNTESDKYCITYLGNPDEYKVVKYIVNNHFLSFQSIEIAEKFLKNFKNLIEEAGDLI